MSMESKPGTDEPVLEPTSSASGLEEPVTESPSSSEVPRNPHSYSLQWFAVIVASTVVFVSFGLGGVVTIVAGVFVFLDAWNAGIYKDKEKKSFLNISPAAWGIAIMGLLIVAYPAYALNRGKLKTMPGKQPYWYLANAFGILALLLVVAQVFVAMVGGA